MPGLNQLKKFSDDVKDLGDESKIRLQRGEKPVVIPLPEGISEEDDSEDFVLGLPDQNNASENADGESVDGDLSSFETSLPENDIPAFDAGDAAGDSGLPDLKDFLKAAQEENGAADSDDDIEELDELDSLETPEDSANDFDLDSIQGLEESLQDTPAPVEEESLPEAAPVADSLDLDSLISPAAADLGDFSDLDLSDFESDVESSAPEDPLAAALTDLDGESPSQEESPAEDTPELDIDSLLGDLDVPSEPDTAPAADAVSEAPSTEETPAADTPDLDIDSLLGDLETPSEPDVTPAAAPAGDAVSDVPSPEENPAGDTPDLDIDSLLGDLETPSEPDAAPAATPGDFDDSGLSDSPLPQDDGLGPVEGGDDFAFDGNTIDLNADLPEEIGENASAASSGAGEDSGVFDALSDLDNLPDFGDSSTGETASETAPVSDFDLDSSISMDNEAPLGDLAIPDAGSPDASSSDLLSDFDTSGLDDFGSMGGEVPDASQEVPSEEFSTEGLDFSDAAQDLASINIEDDFPVTGEGPKLPEDDFELDGNFEIPGFSDTDIADIDKKKGRRIDTPDFSQADMGRPQNTLTEDEYVEFKKNLSLYPLNLRIAIEELIVKNEFTDDAVFEVVEKVLKKVPARQIAGHMEKMLDITISVPRDFERRSVAQYEEYKKSFQYQLKNRILPGAILAVILFIIGYGLFQAGMAFVYRPAMASKLYKQGYALLQNNEYPQSEERFKDAVAYKAVKNWFFTYARGYRQHKQFERAAQMYRNILGNFKYDKEAGLEYAEMELYDRANYAKAEDLVRRNVLDHHINDPDGKLLLGDVFLEWAEVDPEKYENAKQEYLSLMQLYGATDLYMSRMMRYFIRTDKLKNVLEVKGRFYANKNRAVLSSEDWTELSGYLLDKLYGKLSRDEASLRSSITDVLDMLEIAVKSDPENPVARYNLARYFVHNGNFPLAEQGLESSLDLFDSTPVRTKKNIYRQINAARLLGELYADEREYLKAQDVYTRGINVYNDEHARSNLEGDENTGKLFADMGDIDYFISGDFDSALLNYQTAVEMKNDTPSINFRIGAIHYNKKDFAKALGSFIKTAEEKPGDPKLLLALGNTLSLRGDNYAAYGYYSELLTRLDDEKQKHDILFPQSKEDDNELVELYLKADNNLGVTLYRLSRQTGNSAMNGEALVRLSDSIRAWDALTRNQASMVRMEGSNLALQNSKYITHPYPDYEPAIYTDISKTLTDDKVLE